MSSTKQIQYNTVAQQEIEQKIEKLVDLVELVKLQDEIEQHDPSNPIDYSRIYRELIPARLNKLWFNGLLMDGQPVEKFLYDEIEPKLSKYLKKLGIDSQECFVSVEIGMYNEEYPNDWNMTFYMGFDTFGDENIEPGFAIFKIPLYNGEIPSWYIEPAKLIRGEQYDGEFYIKWNDYKGYGESIGCLIHQGEGIFYDFKVPVPYEGLYDYLSDGGFVLRLD